jgi:hypothetical protein
VSRAVLTLLALLVGACATPGATVEPVHGLAAVEHAGGAAWRVMAPGGIGRFRVRLPAETFVEVELVYADGRPFTRLEGVQVDGREADWVRSDGRSRVRFEAGARDRDAVVQVVDYYR